MKKIGDLRDALEAACPEFRTDRDRLSIFVDNGRLVARRTAGLGFEYRYQVTLWVEGFTGGADRLMIPLLLWIRAHQPELMLRFADPKVEDQAIQFSADILDQDTTDVLIKFELNEAVSVIARPDGSGWDVNHLATPSVADTLLEGASEEIPLGEVWLGNDRLVPPQ